MLSKFEVFLYSASLLILPIAVYSLWTGSKPPEGSSLAKYYAAEKYLGPVGNVMLILLCLGNFLKLAAHFGVLRLSENSALLVGLVFLIFAVTYLGLWVAALRKVRRTAQS